MKGFPSFQHFQEGFINIILSNRIAKSLRSSWPFFQPDTKQHSPMRGILGNFGKSRFSSGSGWCNLNLEDTIQPEFCWPTCQAFKDQSLQKIWPTQKALSRWAYFISRKWQLLDFLHILGWNIDIISAQLLDWDMLLTMPNQLYPLILIYIRMASLVVFCLLWVPICISYMYLWTIK